MFAILPNSTFLNVFFNSLIDLKMISLFLFFESIFNDEIQRHLGYLEQALKGVDWFVDNRFSAADIQLSFVAEITPMLYSFESLPNLLAFRNRCQARPAYQRALKKGGFYAFGPTDQ